MINKKNILIIGILIFIGIVLCIFICNRISNNTIEYYRKLSTQKDDFTDEEITYLENNIFYIDISTYGKISSGELKQGRDNNLSVEAHDIKDLDLMLINIKNDKGHDITKVSGASYDEFTYKINDRKIIITIYKNDSSHIKISTEYVDDKVFDIFNVKI